MVSLYKLVFKSGKFYIGMAKDTSRRFRSHRRAAMNGSDLLVYRAWRKYGEPKLQVLAVVEDHMRIATEQKAVAVLGSFGSHGYNMTPGGEISPTSIKLIAGKVSKALLGKAKSSEHRANISKGQARQMSDRYKDKNERQRQSVRLKDFYARNPKLGRKLSEQGTAVVRGVPLSADHKAKISASRMAQIVKKAAVFVKELSLAT